MLLCDFFLSLEFCFIGFSTHAIFASDCLAKFSVNYFLCENCGENLITRSFLDIYIAFLFLLQFFTHCRRTRPRGKLNITTIWY